MAASLLRLPGAGGEGCGENLPQPERICLTDARSGAIICVVMVLSTRDLYGPLAQLVRASGS